MPSFSLCCVSLALNPPLQKSAGKVTALIICNYGIKRKLATHRQRCPLRWIPTAIPLPWAGDHRVTYGSLWENSLLLTTDCQSYWDPHTSHTNVAWPGWGRRSVQYGLKQGCTTAEQIALCQLHELSLFSAFLWIFSCHGSEDTCPNTLWTQSSHVDNKLRYWTNFVFIFCQLPLETVLLGPNSLHHPVPSQNIKSALSTSEWLPGLELLIRYVKLDG